MKYLLILVFLFGLTGCIKETKERGDEKLLSGKKVLFIIASRNFRDEEYKEPRTLLEKRGAKVTVASTTLQEVRGMFGTKAKPDILLREVKVKDYDGIIFIGGSGASEYWNDPTAHQIAKEAVSAGKILGAICIAPVTLANAGVLRGKRATVFPSETSTLRAKGAICTGSSVEVDGNIITGEGPDAATKFGDAIIKALTK